MSKAKLEFSAVRAFSLLTDVREVKVDTPYGAPSDSYFLATVNGRKVAFFPARPLPGRGVSSA